MNYFLLVEDNEDDVFAFQRALKKTNLAVKMDLAVDGQEAMHHLQNVVAGANPPPSIVFLDLKLPYHSGFDLLKYIRSQKSLDDTIAVILTSSAEVKDKQQAYALGARSYLVKPPTDRDIRDLLDSLQTFWSNRGLPAPA